jgi:hypothetical protein
LRTSIEVADIFRAEGAGYRAAQAGHLSLIQLKVMSAIETCRTAALKTFTIADIRRRQLDAAAGQYRSDGFAQLARRSRHSGQNCGSRRKPTARSGLSPTGREFNRRASTFGSVITHNVRAS